MIIRKATVKDFEKLKEIKAEFYLWECRDDDKLNKDYVKKGLGSRLARNLRQDNVAFFIAVEKDEIIGYCGVEIEKNMAHIIYKKTGHIFNLFVKEKYWNKGIGKQLLNTSLDWLKKKKIKDIKIMAYSFNKKAWQIYKNAGFQDHIMILKKKSN